MLTITDLERYCADGTEVSIADLGSPFVITDVRTDPATDDPQPPNGEPVLAWVTTTAPYDGDRAAAIYILADDKLFEHIVDGV
ncbi:MAG TPA: hypothetical protein VK453_25620 [Micromonosporaceae bacterium]|nr:hypothetical protein [Micromonosporaceae bacterium]